MPWEEVQRLAYYLAFKYERFVTGDGLDADDLAQAALEYLWKHSPDPAGVSLPSPVVSKIIVRRILDCMRALQGRYGHPSRERRQTFRSAQRYISTLQETIGEHWQPADTDVDEATRAALLDLPDELARLNPRDRQALLMYASGLLMHEVAGRMGVSEAMVSLRINRARKRLAERIPT